MTTGMRRRPAPAVLVLVLAVLALAATVAARPPHAPPLYDGIGFPDEPYRWVVPPPGEYRTQLAATAAIARIPVSDGTNMAGQALSSEQGPQVGVSVERGALAVPPGVSTIMLRAEPQAPPGIQPDHGQVVSNLYTLTADAGGQAVSLAPGHTLLVNMRAVRPTSQAVVICRWTGQQWEQLPTTRVGADIYAAKLDTLGPLAAVRLDPGAPPSGPALSRGTGAGMTASPDSATASGGPGANALWLSLGLITVVLAAALLLVRRRAGASAGANDGDDGTANTG
jgi:hypothetical protein